MIFKRLPVGALQTNCYIIADPATNEAAVVDPGDEAERIIETVKGMDLKVVYVINTHGHHDHIGADLAVKEEYGADILIHEADAAMTRNPDQNLTFIIGVKVTPFEADRLLSDGDTIRVGGVEMKVIHTPGHTPGCICLLMEDRVLTGDTLFAGGIGRTDVPGGSLEKELASIKERLLVLSDDLLVFPGHGPQTTIGREHRENPFL